MTEQKKPLHVRVAEALAPDIETKIGYPQNVASIADGADFPTGQPEAVWYIREHLKADHDCVWAWDNESCKCRKTWLTRIPRYDTDWSATGPLIQQYGINLERAQAARPDGSPYSAWRWAKPEDEIPPKKQWGDTPLIAICNFILAISAAGKLPKVNPSSETKGAQDDRSQDA